MTTAPTPPPITAPAGTSAERLAGPRVEPDAALLGALRATGAQVLDAPADLEHGSRDWWPLTLHWARAGQLPARPAVVCRPSATEQVGPVLAACSAAGAPVTPAAGRSGVCGGAIPVHGGVVLDLTGLGGVVSVDDAALLVDVRAGTFGTDLEAELRERHGLTLGHWPQSVAISTVGGWLACRSAGQYSTRYGKVEDMVAGLDVVLADGTEVTTGGPPRGAVGPDLTQVFVGSEGTLGVITGARLRLHPVPQGEARAAYGFESFAAGLDACRRILRRGATPAVLRLYDATEGKRSYDTGTQHPLLVLDEADPALVAATMAVVAEECAGAARLDDGLVGRWLEHRNDVSGLSKWTERGLVVDTMEIAAPWSALPAIYDATVAAVREVPHTVNVSAHQSHSYRDGACLYFSLAGAPPEDERERYYVDVWDVATRAVLASGGNLSHHHGVGLNRSRFVHEALGDGGMRVLRTLKQALDPAGVLNPGKLGLPSPFGAPGWP